MYSTAMLVQSSAALALAVCVLYEKRTNKGGRWRGKERLRQRESVAIAV